MRLQARQVTARQVAGSRSSSGQRLLCRQVGSCRPSCRREGAALAAAIVCVLLVMLFSAALIQSLSFRRRSLVWEEREVQCLYLLASATERASAQLAAEPSYAGESWTPAVGDPENGVPGVARIEVETIAEHPGHRRVLIEALWPDDPVQRVRKTAELIIKLSKTGESP